MSQELKPCPFCQQLLEIEDGIYARHPRTIVLDEDDCFLAGMGFGISTWQWQAWNTRSEAHLLRSHKALLNTLKAFPRHDNPTTEGDCKHGEEWDLCDTCKYEWEQALAEWITTRNVALTEAAAQKENGNG